MNETNKKKCIDILTSNHSDSLDVMIATLPETLYDSKSGPERTKGLKLLTRTRTGRIIDFTWIPGTELGEYILYGINVRGL